MRKTLLALAAVAAFSAVPANASLIVNGGFESQPVSSSAGYQTYSGSGVTGWNIPFLTVDVVSSSFAGPAFEGSQYLDLVGLGSIGQIEQTFATVVGQAYTLTFAYANNALSTPSAEANVQVIGGNTLVNVNFAHDSSAPGALDWSTYTTTFTAETAATTLQFTNFIGGNNGGVLLDAVDVAAVPEPSLWATMIAGFGMIGVALRRRRQRGAMLNAI